MCTWLRMTFSAAVFSTDQQATIRIVVLISSGSSEELESFTLASDTLEIKATLQVNKACWQA